MTTSFTARPASPLVRAGLLALLLPAVGCGGREPDGSPTVLARDSAGVRIVESRRPAWPEGRGWKVSARPVLDVGRADGPPESWFSNVMGVARRAGGGILVADMGSSQLRLYDASGRFVRAAGRSGKGPGEFTQIMGMTRLPGDSLLVVDAFVRNLLFTGEGEFVRAVPNLGPFALVSGSLADGSLVSTAPGRGPRPDAGMDSMTLVRLDRSGTVLDTLGRFPLLERRGGGERPQPVVFGPRLSTAVHGGRLHAGYPERYEIGGYSPSGRLERLIRRAWEPAPVDDALRRAYRESLLGGPGEGGRAPHPRLRAQRERLLAGREYAETLPAYQRILPDLEGNLWVQEYEPRSEFLRHGFIHTPDVPSRWSVFDAEGRWLGEVTLPARFSAMEIGADYVAGVWRDADGVEHARVYRLVKP